VEIPIRVLHLFQFRSTANWHWRAIVEAVRSLQVLPEHRVDGTPFAGELSEKEARLIGTAT
jgi:hypothetical protein